MTDDPGRKVSASTVSARLQEVAKAVDKQLEEIAGQRVGFFLFVFAGGEVNYVSSDADRSRATKAMLEIISKWEAGALAIPAHLRQ